MKIKKLSLACFCVLLSTIITNQALAMISTLSNIQILKLAGPIPKNIAKQDFSEITALQKLFTEMLARGQTRITAAQELAKIIAAQKSPKVIVLQQSPEIAAYLIDKMTEGKCSANELTTKIHTLRTHIQNPAQGDPEVLVALLRIIDYIQYVVEHNKLVQINEILELIEENTYHKIGSDIINYIHHLITLIPKEDEFYVDKEAILEAICNKDALEKFKISEMEIAYFVKRGFPQNTIDTELARLETYSNTCSITAGEPGKFIALLILINWMRESTKNTQVLSDKQITNLRAKLIDKLPNVYKILSKNTFELEKIIKTVDCIIKNPGSFSLQEQQLWQDEAILEVLEDNLAEEALRAQEEQVQFLKEQKYSEDGLMAKLKERQEYTENFGSLFKKPEMFDPLFEAIDKVLNHLRENSKLTFDELLINMQYDPIINRLSDDEEDAKGTIMQIHDIIQRKGISDIDKIIEKLEEANIGAHKSSAENQPRFGSPVEYDFAPDWGFQPPTMPGFFPKDFL